MLAGRSLQPPPRLAQQWPKQRETLLRKVAAALEGTASDNREAAADSAEPAHADAIAAAERAMQELLVCFWGERAPVGCQM